MVIEAHELKINDLVFTDRVTGDEENYQIKLKQIHKNDNGEYDIEYIDITFDTGDRITVPFDWKFELPLE